MLFNSYTFILFFLVILVLHNLAPLSWKAKKVNLLLASYLFYAAWNPPFIVLLWLSTLIDYVVGKRLYSEERPRHRKLLLALSLVGNLGLLAFFKYGGFLLENFVALTAALGIDFHPAKPDIILPVGISFYTFQTLSYTIDMYRRTAKPERSLLDFSLFVTFLPQLVAGPIVRPAELLPQFKKPHTANRDLFTRGLLLLTLGLFMKVVLADSLLSRPSDQVFGASASLPTLDAWAGVLAFSGQIFFDFAGYSTCAIGIGYCLGFSLPHNFRYPYAAIGFSDFWRRWHITLSSWLRDYLYIPLGGNRAGGWRTYFNLMVTMLLGGLWHGASWTFVVWGGLHGLYLCIERLFRPRPVKGGAPQEGGENEMEAAPVVVASLAPAFFRRRSTQRFFAALLTFFLINITWVFFRATDFSTAWRLLASMFGRGAEGAALLQTIDIIKVGVITVLLLATHWYMRQKTVLELTSRLKWYVVGVAWAAMLILLIWSQESSSSFIYFQF
jgi:alginate O-acetyltransferase complex protein AlgI